MNNLVGKNEKAVMVTDPGQDLPVQPQQLIGGINGMILQLHKMHVELEEYRQKQQEHAEKIKMSELKNEDLKNEMDDLRKTKERLTEQNEFLQKSLNKKKTENNELLERLKQAEIQLGESGSVLDTVRNLEEKNELLSVRMSNAVSSTEEEVAKARAQHDCYTELFNEANRLNERNMTIQKNLDETEKISRQTLGQTKALVEKAEKACVEITNNLDQILRAKEKYLELSEKKQDLEMDARKRLEANEVLERENKDLKKKMKEFETRYGTLGRALKEQRKNNDVLKEQFSKTKQEREDLYKEVQSLREKLENQEESRSSKDEVENCELKTSGNSLFTENYVAIVIEMQELFKDSRIRDEELASLENLAGIPEQRVYEVEPSVEREGSGIASCIRGLVAMKDSQIGALMDERDKLFGQVVETKKAEYRQGYLLNEMLKEKDELLAKITACQEKYHKVKDEKEEMRKDLLVRNATDKMTSAYINSLKEENDRYKNELQKQGNTLRQKYNAMKIDVDKKLQTRDTLIKTMKNELVVCKQEKDRMENELDSHLMKNNAIKQQIISIFGK